MVLRSARPLSPFQNKGNILRCGSHNTKETLMPGMILSGRGVIFQFGSIPRAKIMWIHWLHITSFGQKSRNYTNTQEKLTKFFPHPFFSPDISFKFVQLYKRSHGNDTSHMNSFLLLIRDSVQFSGSWGANLRLCNLTLEVLICHYVEEGKEKIERL